jgi:hypothetical protein
MLTLSELETAVAAADDRARRARAEAARLRREIERAQVARTAARERLVGSAVLAWCRDDERTRAGIVRYLSAFLRAAPDLDLLRGSPLDLDAAVEALRNPAAPAETEEAAHEPAQ